MIEPNFDNYIENKRMANESQKVYCVCERCGRDINYGETYYRYDNNDLCEDCFDDIQMDEKIDAERQAGDDDE